MNFMNLSNSFSRTRPCALLSLEQKQVPEAEMFLVISEPPVHKADNVTAVCTSIIWTLSDT
jgi:hypothetical protein